jgi:hypothetical protein
MREGSRTGNRMLILRIPLLQGMWKYFARGLQALPGANCNDKENEAKNGQGTWLTIFASSSFFNFLYD